MVGMARRKEAATGARAEGGPSWGPHCGMYCVVISVPRQNATDIFCWPSPQPPRAHTPAGGKSLKHQFSPAAASAGHGVRPGPVSAGFTESRGVFYGTTHTLFLARKKTKHCQLSLDTRCQALRHAARRIYIYIHMQSSNAMQCSAGGIC